MLKIRRLGLTVKYAENGFVVERKADSNIAFVLRETFLAPTDEDGAVFYYRLGVV